MLLLLVWFHIIILKQNRTLNLIDIPVIWKINFVWMQWVVVVPTLIGAIIELDRIKKEASGQNDDSSKIRFMDV